MVIGGHISKQLTHGVEYEHCSVVYKTACGHKGRKAQKKSNEEITKGIYEYYKDHILNDHILYTIARKLSFISPFRDIPYFPKNLNFLQKNYSPDILLVAYKDKQPYMELSFDCLDSSSNLEWQSVGSGIKTRSEFFNLTGATICNIVDILNGFLYHYVNNNILKQRSQDNTFKHYKNHSIHYKITQFGEYIFTHYNVVDKRQKLSNNNEAAKKSSLHITNTLYIPTEQDDKTAKLKYIKALYTLKYNLDHNKLVTKTMDGLFEHCTTETYEWQYVEARNEGKHAWNIKHPICILQSNDFCINAYLRKKIILPDSNSASDAHIFIAQCHKMIDIMTRHIPLKTELETQQVILNDSILFLKAKLVEIAFSTDVYKTSVIDKIIIDLNLCKQPQEIEKEYIDALRTHNSYEKFKEVVASHYESLISAGFNKIQYDVQHSPKLIMYSTLFKSIEQKFQDFVFVDGNKYILVENRCFSSKQNDCKSSKQNYGKNIKKLINSYLQNTKFVLKASAHKALEKANKQWEEVEEAFNEILTKRHEVDIAGATSTIITQDNEVDIAGATSTIITQDNEVDIAGATSMSYYAS